MKCLNKREKSVTILALLAILFCAVPVIAQSADEGIFLEETKLKERDTIYEDDVLTYKKIISSKEERETVVLPESLAKLEPGSAIDETAATVSGAVPIADSPQYMVAIPCMVRPEAVLEGSVFVDGIELFVAQRPEAPLGEGRAAQPLPSYAMNLYKTMADMDAKNPITNGAIINLTSPIFIGIIKENFVGINAGTTYTIDLPVQISSAQADGAQDLKVKIGETYYKFGVLSWTAGSKQLSVVFNNFTANSGGMTIGLADLTDIYMAFGCNLDKDNLVADVNGKVTIALPNGKTLDIIVPELKPKSPDIQKSVGTLAEDGSVLWTINYTHPSIGYPGERPAKMVDTIPANLRYVSGSGNVYLNDSVTPETPSNLSYSGADGKLTYDIAAAGLAGEDKVKITYKTELSEAAFSENWAAPTTQFTYVNKVEGLDAGDAALTSPLSATANLVIPVSWPGRTVLSKNATVGGNGDDRTITWTLVVNAQKQNFEHLTVMDTMGKGLELDKTSVQIVGAPAVSIPSDAIEVDEDSDPDDKTIMTIKLVKDGVPSPAAEKYTITYKTAIKKDYFNKPGSLTDADISNNANLSYSWPAGVSPGTPAMPPSIGKTPGDMDVNNALIGKKAISYDYTKNSITWNITINPNQVDVTQAVFVDDLNTTDRGHLFVLPGGDTAAAKTAIEQSIKAALGREGLSGSLLSSVTLTDNVLMVELGNIGAKSFTFPVTTYVENPGKWATNEKATYENTVTMKNTVTVIGADPVTNDVSATAKKDVVNNVLKKESGTYLPEEKKIEWLLTVNENAVNLGQVTITDTLSELLSCSAEDVNGATLDGGTFSGTNTFSFDNSSNTITIALDSISAKKVIKFKTSVDVDAELFRELENIPISNQASIVSSANSTPVNSNQVNISIDNQVIDKTGEKLGGGQSILSYRINLNPTGMDLLKGQPAGTKLTVSDQLPDGLYLDMESIKIYHATANPVSTVNGKYTTGLIQGVEVTSAVIDYQASENYFSIEIPDPAKSYIIKYHAYIVKAGVELKNNVKIMGSVLQGGDDHISSQHSFRLDAFGGAGFSLPRDKFISLRIQKVNKDGNKLTGAGFALYADNKGERLLAKGTTDNGTGICTLAIPQRAASGIDTLYWKETTAPVGYEINDQWHEVNTASMPDTDITMVNLREADAVLGKIKIRKTDEAGAVLTGAAFAVYKEESCETLAAAEKPVDASGEVTFDGLYPGRTYWVKEIKTPRGYVPGNPVAVTASSAPALTAHIIKNEKADVTLEITKADGEDHSIKIQDVEFTLYEDSACTKQFGSAQKTNQLGIASFKALMPHTTYYLKETKAAADYMENASVHTVETADNNETLTKELVNYKIGWDKKASIEIKKTDGSGIVSLEHAVFELYANDKTTLLGEATTDKDGLCTFAQLKAGTYYIKETKAPEGYKLVEDFVKVQVRQNIKQTITVKNILLDLKEENVSGGGSQEGGTGREGEDKTDDKSGQENVHKSSTIPKTGVEDRMIGYALGLIVSLLAVGGLTLLLVRRKKRS